MTSKQRPPATSSTYQPSPIRWTGGVLRPYGYKHQDKPMRIAAWINNSGDLLAGAIVEGHGPTVLRELLTELLERTPEAKRPIRLVVWPNVRAAFANVEYPPVEVDRDRFLTVVVGDHGDAGRMFELPVRVGVPAKK